jgi:hypothetical protein
MSKLKGGGYIAPTMEVEVQQYPIDAFHLIEGAVIKGPTIEVKVGQSPMDDSEWVEGVGIVDISKGIQFLIP